MATTIEITLPVASNWVEIVTGAEQGFISNETSYEVIIAEAPTASPPASGSIVGHKLSDQGFYYDVAAASSLYAKAKTTDSAVTKTAS